MVEYKSIPLPIDIQADDKVLDIVQDCLSRQPEPRPYITKDADGYVFHFHTLDLRLLERDAEHLTAGTLFVQPAPESREAKRLLESILDEVGKIGSYGVKSGKRQYVGFAAERKVRGRKAKEQDRSQYYYAQGHGFSEANNPLPEELANQIICGDSLEVLKAFPDNCVDLILTSPPYNFGLEYEGQGDAYFWEKYFDTLFAIFDQCIRVLKFGGRIAVNIQPLFSDYIPSHHIIGNYFLSRKMIWKGEILWEKNNYNCKYTAWGSWKSPSNPYLKYTWEFIEVFAKGTLRKAGNPEDADITADEFKKWVFARWSIAPERNMKEFGHPAMFPEELALRVIKLFSFVGDVVLDPFNGAGTTTAVAQRLGRRFVGIDISPEYCAVAKKRLRATLL
ncbi:MAG: site-specific DNA-methyltransferase [Anaerolineae bacterium]|nr:site-specific DNA-methyltransferase [Anaerolineae bacterium]